MLVIEADEECCPKCNVHLIPEVYSHPKHNPKELGNPWSCPKCKELYGCKDGTTYWEHIKIIQQYYEDGRMKRYQKG